MRIEYIGHACFKLNCRGYTVILDPYSDGKVPGLAPVVETTNQILCSHRHLDHCGTEHIRLLEPTAPPVRVSTIPSYHDEVRGAKRGSNTIHLLEDGETRLAHLGDLGCPLSPEQIERLTGLDVLLIPVGGHYTIDGQQAAEVVRQLRPRMVIPMHYRGEGFGYDVIETEEPFLRAMGAEPARPGSCVDTAECPAGQVVVLTPGNRLG